MQILVVDDSRTMRMLVIRTLRQAGFGGHDIIEAGDGLEALELIRTSSPDIVLCDWNMPRMNGLELLRSLRRSGDARPFGFVTSEGTPAMREIADAEGASFIITKPFTADVFTSVLGGVGNVVAGDEHQQGVPNPHHLFKVLDTLIGRPVSTRDSVVMVDPHEAALVWSYVFEDDTLAAVGAIDLRLAAVLAAGFGLLPVGRVDEALEARVLPKDLEENVREVFNILVALYTPMSDEHIRFGAVWRRGVSELPPAIVELLTCRTRRLDAVVTIGGYGEGCFSAVPAWRLVRKPAVAV